MFPQENFPFCLIFEAFQRQIWCINAFQKKIASHNYDLNFDVNLIWATCSYSERNLLDIGRFWGAAQWAGPCQCQLTVCGTWISSGWNIGTNNEKLRWRNPPLKRHAADKTSEVTDCRRVPESITIRNIHSDCFKLLFCSWIQWNSDFTSVDRQ